MHHLNRGVTLELEAPARMDGPLVLNGIRDNSDQLDLSHAQVYVAGVDARHIQ